MVFLQGRSGAQHGRPERRAECVLKVGEMGGYWCRLQIESMEPPRGVWKFTIVNKPPAGIPNPKEIDSFLKYRAGASCVEGRPK